MVIAAAFEGPQQKMAGDMEGNSREWTNTWQRRLYGRSIQANSHYNILSVRAPRLRRDYLD